MGGCVKLVMQMRDEEVGMKGGCGDCGDCMHVWARYYLQSIKLQLHTYFDIAIAYSFEKTTYWHFILMTCMQISSNKNVTRERHLGLAIARPCT